MTPSAIDRRTNSGAVWAVAACSLAVVAFLAFSWLGTAWHAAVSIPLPYRRMEIPVLWWGLYLSYAIGARRLLRCDLGLGRAVLLDGLLLHIQWLLVTFYTTAPITATVGRVYGWYIALVVLAVVMGTAYRAGKVARVIWEAARRGACADVIRLPLCAGTALMGAYAVWQDQWLVSCAAILGCSLGWRAGCWRVPERLHARLPQGLQRRGRLEWAGVGALVVVALCLRVAWYLHLVSLVGLDYQTGFLAASDDGQFYHSAASTIAEDPSVLLDRSNPVVSSSFDPLYPLLLGLWYRLAGIHFLPAVVVQCLLGSLVVVLVYLIGKELGGGSLAIGYLAAALATVSQPLIFSSAVYGIEALYIPVLAWWLWSAVRYAKPSVRSRRWVWALGTAGGLLLGLRRFAPLFLLALLPWMVWAKRDVAMRVRLRDWLAAAGLALAVYAPVEAMYAAGGQARLLSRGGAVYWEAPAQFPDVVPDNSRLIALGIDPFRDPLGSLARAAAQPIEVAQAVWAILPKRVTAFFFWAPFGYFNTVTLLNPTIPNAFTPIEEFYLALAVLVGVVWALRHPASRTVGGLLLLTIGIQAFVHSVLFFTHSIRYSIPVRPYLTIFAAAATAPLVRAIFMRGSSTHGLGGHPGLQQSA